MVPLSYHTILCDRSVAMYVSMPRAFECVSMRKHLPLWCRNEAIRFQDNSMYVLYVCMVGALIGAESPTVVV